MNFLNVLTEPAIIIITVVFLSFIMTVLHNYRKIEKNLKPVFDFLHALNKKEISYRFNQLDEFMSNNYLTSICWEDFKKALIFPDKFLATSQETTNIRNYSSDIYLTVDASYFFNEDSLIYSKINNKFIQAMPTLLTGLGPFFTFLKMAIAFTAVDFSITAVDGTLTELISGIQIAALCSVFAVGYSLLFMFIEKVFYNRRCRKYYLLIQKEFVKLFDICTSEQFLLDLLKESKIHGLNNEKILKSLPEDIAKNLSKSIGEVTVPYLENILYSLNKLNEAMDKKSKGDVIDKLF
ncbi:hypothetical protein J6R97_08770 [bacterium]|nr:hypothetical protein [bacterium]